MKARQANALQDLCERIGLIWPMPLQSVFHSVCKAWTSSEWWETAILQTKHLLTLGSIIVPCYRMTQIFKIPKIQKYENVKHTWAPSNA